MPGAKFGIEYRTPRKYRTIIVSDEVRSIVLAKTESDLTNMPPGFLSKDLVFLFNLSIT